MAIFRDLKGRFFSIPEAELEKFRISPSELASSERGAAECSSSPSEGTTIIVNQFFAPVDPGMQCQGGANDFAAQYTYPAAWGGNK